jgi:hypothetical protein
MSNDQATAERKADTGPLPPLPEAPQVPANRPRRTLLPLLAGGGAVALLVVAGLVFALQANSRADQRPVETVRAFIGALEARDATAMLAQVEPTVLKRQLGPEIRAYVEYITEIRFDDARYELLANDGERAQVRMTATMVYTIDYGERRSGQTPIDATYDLRLVEGAWYLSGVTLPQT